MKSNSILLCLLFAIAANLITPAAKAQANVNDSLALVDLYNSTDGPNWKQHSNWLTAAPLSSWTLVQLNSDGRVFWLDLASNHLNGVLPASIGNLTELEFLELGGNKLHGAIPAEIGNLIKLYSLELHYNQLSGSIPASIGNLTKIHDFWAFHNRLTGAIPSTMGNFTSVDALYLDHNHLSGAIPASLGNLANVSVLRLSYNNLHGHIPSELGNCSKLVGLNLDNNHLQGSIPLSFSKLKALEVIDVSYNQLSQHGNLTFPKHPYNVTVFINNNLFTFDGLESLTKNFFFSYTAPQNTILPIHQNSNSLSVSAGGTLSNNTYNWFKVGATDSTTIKGDSTFTPSASGSYYAKVTNAIVTKLTLYSDMINYTMPAAKQSNTFIAKAATPSVVTSNMQVYPNPANNLVHIQTAGTATIALTNATGKTLFTKTINNTADINVSSFASGIYYIQNKTTGEMQKIVVIY